MSIVFASKKYFSLLQEYAAQGTSTPWGISSYCSSFEESPWRR
jgi:hypothetical protein